MMKKNDCILWTYNAGKVWKKCTQVRDLEKRVADARGFLELADRVLTGEDNDSVGDLSQVPMENLLAALEQLQGKLEAANTRLAKQAAFAVDNMALAKQVVRLESEKAAAEKEAERLEGLVDAQQKTVDQVGSENLQLEKRVASITHCENCGGDWVDNGLQGECFCKRVAELEGIIEYIEEYVPNIVAEALSRKDGD